MQTRVEEGHLGGYLMGGDECSYTPTVWDFLLTTFNPRSMFDVGCGEGHAARWFLNHRVDALGIDGCESAFHDAVMPKYRFLLHDYTQGPAPLILTFDLIWACEFVEHVEEQHVDNFLATFSRGRVVAMTHAVPGQDGYHHVNCQPEEYWIEKLAGIGFLLEAEYTKQSRELEMHRDAYWKKTGLIFRKV